MAGLAALLPVGSPALRAAAPAAMEHVVLHRDDTQYYLGPSLAWAANGELLLAIREAHARPGFVSHVDLTSRGVLFRSTDGGRTFGDKRVIDDRTHRFSGTQDTTVTVLRDGSLLMIVNDYHRPDGKTRVWARIFCLRSTDQGATWQRHGQVGDGAADRLHFLEPGWVRRRSGRILAMLRTRGEGAANVREAPPAGFLFQGVSDDDGRTWTRPQATPLWGFPAHLLELRDGRVLCAYGYRQKPYGVRATLSDDGGRTWDVAREIVVRADGGTSDLGYPVSIQLADGRVLLAYYFNQETAGDPASGTRYIAGTFLRL